MADLEKTGVLMAMDAYLPYVDGVITCMHNYCKELNGTVNLTAAVPESRNFPDLPYRTVRCKGLRIPFFKIYYPLPCLDKKFREKLYAADFDIVHIHSPFGMGKFALKLARKKNVPAVATFHTNLKLIFKHTFKSKFITGLLTKRIGRFYNKLDAVFVCSDEVAGQLRSYGYTGKIQITPFGTEFALAGDRAALKKHAGEKFGISENETVFLFVGRIVELKRIGFILDSLKIFERGGNKFKFFICGDGVHLKKFKKYAKKLFGGAGGGEVIFTGFMDRDELPPLYARADLFLFPSLYDNFGLVKVEAAAHSTPGLFIKDSAAGAGITDGVNGFLSENSPDAFAQKIAEAVSDKEALAETGRNAARDLYVDWGKCSDILLGKYHEVIGGVKKRH